MGDENQGTSDLKVILLTGPGGAGKTSMGQRIGEVPGWRHIAEDRVWDELPRNPHSPRTESEKAAVQRRVVSLISEQLQRNLNVVVDFILYESPPQPIVYYQSEVRKIGVEILTRVLCPSVERVLERQQERGNSHDTEASYLERRRNAEHQFMCASSPLIERMWIIDSSDLSLEEVYRRFFASIVE